MAFLDFAALKESIKIEQTIEPLGLKMRQGNNQFRGPCPACRSSGPRSLVVTPEKQAFYCFEARVGGDVIALAAHINDSTMKDAADFLSGTPQTSDTVPRERAKEVERNLQPLSYLEPDHSKLQDIGLTPETLQEFRAGYAPKGIMRGKLAVPIHNAAGRLVGYFGSSVDPKKPEIIYPKGFNTEAYVFNAHQLDDGEITLCRSPLEVLMVWQNGVQNAISFLSEAISPNQIKLLASILESHENAFLELP